MSALRLINETTISSNVQSVNVADVFSSTYDAYKIVGTGFLLASTGGTNINLRVISFPSFELFEIQSEDYKKEIIGDKVNFAVEAGVINGWEKYVRNENFLTPFQIKQMSFQPDFILEYAHYLGEHFEEKGMKNIQVFTDSFVALNGRSSQRFINPNVDLLTKKESFLNKDWVLPLNDEIKGL